MRLTGALLTAVSHRIMSSKCLVAVAQMRSTNDVAVNARIGQRLIEQAKEQGAKMLFMPECFDYMGESREETLSKAHSSDGPIMVEYQRLANQHSMWLSLGGWHESCGEKIKNTHTIISSDGTIVSTYHKSHLFDVDLRESGGVRLAESDFTVPGERIAKPVDTPAGSVATMTCYDVRFPEMAQKCRSLGAQILTYPSAFTQRTGDAHWVPLLRARAIETQCYVIAAAQTGTHNSKRSSHGHATMISPWGDVLVDLGVEENTIGTAVVDSDLIDRVRTSMPVESHRRPNIYAQLDLTSITDSAPFTFGGKSISPDTVFACSTHAYAVVNLKPVLPGHVLIVARSPSVVRLGDLPAGAVGDVFQLVQRVQSMIEKHFDTDSSTVAIQDGVAAGRTMHHLHIHVIPRKVGDFADPDELYKALQENDADTNAVCRTHGDMAEEAKVYRNFMTNL